MTNAFEIVKGDGPFRKVSYKDMGAKAARTGEDPKYIIASFNGTAWYYWENHTKNTLLSMSAIELKDIETADLTQEIGGVAFDHEEYFADMNSLAYFAVTDIEPPVEYDISNKQDYYTYTGGSANMYDQTKLGEAIDFAKTPPYIVEKTPYNSRLEQGQTYDVKVVYSEGLMRKNDAVEAELTWGREVNGARFSDFAWDGDRTVTFKLTTGSNYGTTTPYYFVLENLVGKDSRRDPSTISFCTYNNNVFACPKLPGDSNKIHANTPALVADSDLSKNDFFGADNRPIENFDMSRLALVASDLSDDMTGTLMGGISEKLEEDLGEGTEVLSAKTYDITMSLCSSQVDYIEGKPLKVFVPFPEGYDAGNKDDVTFKAYHFDKNGNPEEIDCVVTESGIIMYCSSFSPYAVVALEKTADAEKKVLVSVTGGGSADTGLVKLEEGERATVTLTPDDGYAIAEVLLNGQPVTLQSENTVVLEYEKLQENNTLTVSFLLADMDITAPVEPDQPDQPDEPDEPDQPDQPDEPDQPDQPDEPDQPDVPGDAEEDSASGTSGAASSDGTTTRLPDGSVQTVKTDKKGVLTATLRVSSKAESGKPIRLTIPAMTPDSGDRLKVTMPAAGQVLLQVPAAKTGPSTVAAILHADGSREILRKSTAGDGVVTLPLSGSATVLLTDNGKTFADTTGHWAADVIDFVSAREIFSGVGEARFAPDDTLSRAMLAQVLHNLESNPAHDFTGAFPDLAEGHWAGSAVRWAAAQGILQGYPDGRAGVSDDISRQDLIVMLWRYAGQPEADGSLAAFADSGAVQSYARPAMEWAHAQGILSGKPGGLLDPNGTATRAETAAMLARFMMQ